MLIFITIDLKMICVVIKCCMKHFFKRQNALIINVDGGLLCEIGSS